MTIYIINFLSMALYGMFFNRKILCSIATIQMFLILAFRIDTLGVDLKGYASSFDYISGLSFGDMISRLRFVQQADLPYPMSLESGWVVYNWIISTIGGDFHSLLVVCALINMGACGWFIYKYSQIPWLSFSFIIGLNIYSYMFGILRQSLALSIIVFAVCAFDQKKYKKAIILLVIACTFHRTAVIAITLLFIMKSFSNNKKIYKRVFLLWIPYLLLASSIYQFIIARAMFLVGKAYVDSEITQWNNLLNLLIFIVIAIILFYDFRNIHTRIEKLSIWASLIAVYWQTLAVFNGNISRCIEYFTLFTALVVPQVIQSYKDTSIAQIGKWIVYILLLCFYIYSLMKDESIVPYISIINEIF